MDLYSLQLSTQAHNSICRECPPHHRQCNQLWERRSAGIGRVLWPVLLMYPSLCSSAVGPVAQWQEHLASIQKVTGLNPSWIPAFSVDFCLSPKPISAFIPAYTEHFSAHSLIWYISAKRLNGIYAPMTNVFQVQVTGYISARLPMWDNSLTPKKLTLYSWCKYKLVQGEQCKSFCRIACALSSLEYWQKKYQQQRRQMPSPSLWLLNWTTSAKCDECLSPITAERVYNRK